VYQIEGDTRGIIEGHYPEHRVHAHREHAKILGVDKADKSGTHDGIYHRHEDHKEKGVAHSREQLVCIDVYGYIHMYVFIYINGCICIYIYVYKYTYMYIWIWSWEWS